MGRVASRMRAYCNVHGPRMSLETGQGPSTPGGGVAGLTLTWAHFLASLYLDSEQSSFSSYHLTSKVRNLETD